MTFESVDYGDEDEAEGPCDAHGWRKCKRCASRVDNWDNETGRREIARLNDELRTARAEAARLREQLQSATLLPERWRGLMAERDAARRELAEVREQLQSARPSICDYCGMDRRVHDSRTWMAHCEATAGAHPEALKQMRARCTDASGWTAAENADFEELYGVRAAMYLRAANDRVWEVVKELRNAAVADGRNPYEDPMAQRLAGALIGEQKAADGG